MAEQTGELRRIHWDELFPFTRLFKTFRMAIQPGKLGLALAGVILMGILGGLLDFLWVPSAKPVGPELWAYWQVPDIHAWRETFSSKRLDALSQLYGKGGLLAGKDSPDLKRPSVAVNRALSQLKEEFRAATKLKTDEKAIAVTARLYGDAYEQLAAYRSRGVFRSFLQYEQQVVNHFLDESRQILLLDWWSVARGTNEVITARYRTPEIRHAGDFGDVGMVGTLLLMLRGWQWMICQHPFFASLFGLGSLAIWSLFGGAVCRMAALNAARDEQISPRAALGFASRKFLAFVSAPLLPLIMIAGIGVLLWAGGFLILQVPYVGELIGGLLMILALLGGFVMSLVLIGAVCGGGLLWPTIAVEGSDGFDAMSRSYNYFYARPWRLAFYTIVAAVYAGVTYIALRYFVYMILRLTRSFVGAGAGVWTHRPGTGQATATKLDAMWAIPRPDNLLGQWGTAGFGQMHFEALGSVFIYLWLMVIVLALCAYLVSFFFSAATITYTLLRQQVDATDYEDVFVEEEEDALAAPASPAPTSTTGPASAPDGPAESSTDPAPA